MTRPDQAALIAGLRAWTRGHDPHVRAAVELLIEHNVWLRRADFTQGCIFRSGRRCMSTGWPPAPSWTAGRSHPPRRWLSSTDGGAGGEPLPAADNGRRERPVDRHRGGPRGGVTS